MLRNGQFARDSLPLITWQLIVFDISAGSLSLRKTLWVSGVGYDGVVPTVLGDDTRLVCVDCVKSVIDGGTLKINLVYELISGRNEILNVIVMFHY